LSNARYSTPVVFVAAVIVALACGGDGGAGSSTAPASTPARIVISPARTDTLAPGVTYQLSATVSAADNTTLIGYPVTYTSSDSTVAAVSNTGLVTAGDKIGGATITASAGSAISNSVTIVVFDPALVGVPKQITLVQSLSTSLTVGASTPVSVRVTDAFDTPVAGTGVTFSINDGNGTVTPTSVTTNASGVASTTWTVGTNLPMGNSVLVSAGAVQTVVTCVPLPGPPVSLIMSFPFAGLTVGSGGSLSVTAQDAYGNEFTPPSPQFVSRNPTVVTLASPSPPANVSFTSQTAGQSYIVASAAGLADSTLVAVFPSNGVLVSVAPPSFDLVAGTTFSTGVQISTGPSTLPIGSLTATITWDPTVLTYVSDVPATGFDGSVTVNTTNVAHGSLTLAVASATSLGQGPVLRTITFAAASTPGRHGTLGVTVSDISTNNFVTLLPVTQGVSFPVNTR
jgi:hypothetical protein